MIPKINITWAKVVCVSVLEGDRSCELALFYKDEQAEKWNLVQNVKDLSGATTIGSAPVPVSTSVVVPHYQRKMSTITLLPVVCVHYLAGVFISYTKLKLMESNNSP